MNGGFPRIAAITAPTASSQMRRAAVVGRGVEQRSIHSAAFASLLQSSLSSEDRRPNTAITTTTRYFSHGGLFLGHAQQQRWIHSTCTLWQSTSPNTATDGSSSDSSQQQQQRSGSSSRRLPPNQWRQMVKPFLLKCHPDVMASQRPETVRNSSDAFSVIQKTNLRAIQNLNSYLDTMQSLIDQSPNKTSKAYSVAGAPPPPPLPKLPGTPLAIIDFILLVADTGAKVKQNKAIPVIMSRRKVELMYPTKEMMRTMTVFELRRYAMGQLIQLLRVAGLEVPDEIKEELLKEERAKYLSKEDLEEDNRRKRQPGEKEEPEVFSRRRYLANKRAFWDMIDFNKLDKMHDESQQDMQAYLATMNLYRNNVDLKQKVVAKILARIHVQRYGYHDHLPAAAATSSPSPTPEPLISMTDELIAFRRLSLLLEDNFEVLDLEDWGAAWWDKLHIILTPERPYNTSSSALHKRTKLRAGDNGFSLTFHANHEGATMTIPIDFRDDELLAEWKRNLSDYQVMVGDGFEQILKDPNDPVARQLFNDSFWRVVDPW